MLKNNKQHMRMGHGSLRFNGILGVYIKKIVHKAVDVYANCINNVD